MYKRDSSTHLAIVMYQRGKKTKEFKITQVKIRVRVLVPGKAEPSAPAMALGLAAQRWGMETLDSVEG